MHDENEFQEAWSSLYPNLHSFASKYVDRELAMDLVHDLFLLALRHWTTFKSSEHLDNWARKTLRWRIHDHFTSCEERPLVGEIQSSVNDSPEHSAIGHELREKMLSLITRLPRRQREVMRRTFNGESVHAIATAMGITPATVRSLKRFARHRIVTELADVSTERE